MSHVTHRRDFLKLAGAAGLTPSLASSEKAVRIGFVGVGRRGAGLVKSLLTLPGVELPAICDINEANLRNAQSIVEKAGRKRPDGYWRGLEDFRRMVERDDLDAVMTATPWKWHTPVCVAAMKAGKYAATEVPAALTIDECWELVETSEQTGMPCMLLENDCFGPGALLALNLVQQGVLGELIHCVGGYDHDIRAGILRGGKLGWRARHALKRNANLYPTHPIGPIAWWTNINRGDRFTYLTSMSSKSRGLNLYLANLLGRDHPNAKLKFVKGDVNTSLIMTERGVTITLNHDTQSPRPYSDSGSTKIPLMVLYLQGTKGIFSGSLEKIYVEGRSPKSHTWEDTARYYEQYQHVLWKELGETARGSGHGGEDYVELHQFVRAVRNKIQTPIDVYDAATWSVITPLSEQSVAARSAPVDFPERPGCRLE
jgi:predicted dehydrogenase